MATPSLIELLEPRIAPASFVNAFVVSYTDVDGDLVKIKSSKPIFHDDLREFTFTAAGQGEELSELLLKPSASGADLKVKVTETGASGDGAVNVGFINATGFDLRSVTIEGALERISVGDSDPTGRGIGLLHVRSLGPAEEGEPEEATNLSSGAGTVRIDGDLSGRIVTGVTYRGKASLGDVDRFIVGGDLTGSVTAGAVGKIKLLGDLVGGESANSGAISAELVGEIVVKGSVIGARGDYSGSVEAWGVGLVAIEGDIVGGQGIASGRFEAGGNQNATFWLAGSVIGGSGAYSGGILARLIDQIAVDGSIHGGSGKASGYIYTFANSQLPQEINVRISGDLVGGAGDASGYVLTNGRFATLNVEVGGDVRGTLYSSSGMEMSAGSIAGDRLGKVIIGGSVIAGERSDQVTQITSSAVRASISLAKLKVAGSIEGNPTNVVGISAGDWFKEKGDHGIGVLKVDGSVTHAEVSAGYSDRSRDNRDLIFFNPGARIGEVRIGKDLNASSITAGIHPGADFRFGTGDDHSEGREAADRHSRIASITVGGQVYGTSTATDAFGIVAQQVNSITIGGVPVLLTSELDNIQLAPDTHDLLVCEHA